MKKVVLTILLVAGFTVNAVAEHPKAEHPSAAMKAETPVEQVAENLQNSGVMTAQEVSLVNTSIALLLENGATADEAENIVSQAVDEAKAQELDNEGLAAKVSEAAQDYIAAKEADDPNAGSEHPTSEHPTEHPGQ